MVMRIGAVAVAVTAAGVALGVAPALASAQPVTNVNDSGPGSLRRAIAQANLNANFDVISFNIPGAGPHTIAPASNLPAVTQPVMIDGFSEPGPWRVVLDATAVADGLQIFTNDSTVRGLVVQNAGDDAIAVQGARNSVKGNYLGTDSNGQPAGLGNAGDGVEVDGDDNQIGGVKPEDRNVLADNAGAGARVTGPSSTGNLIQGNLVGLDSTGTVAAGNADGVAILGDRNVVGGPEPEARNVIADHVTGLTVDGDDNRVENNAIGTDITAAVELSNFQGVTINGDGNVVGGSSADGTGNVISGNQFWGAKVETGAGNKIAGNLIGPGGTGAPLAGFNNQDGVEIESSDNQVGGAGAGEGNVISLNDVGVLLTGDANTVLGNKVGTTVEGDAVLANDDQGILVNGHHNLIGGAESGQGNVVSGNNVGVEIRSDAPLGPLSGSANEVVGNLIGTDAGGVLALPNIIGVKLREASDNLIGGGGPEEGNVISGNSLHAVELFHDGSGVDDNVIAGNRIGTDRAGRLALGNGGSGVTIDDGNGNVVGGLKPGEANIIAFNDDEGVSIDSGVENALLGNPIYANGGLAIDLEADGVLNGNDLLDVDTGANDLQNRPVITSSAVVPGRSATIDWTLGSEAARNYRLEFFAGVNCGAPAAFLGAVEVTTDGLGAAGGRTVLALPTKSGTMVSATATKLDSATGSPLGTSEVSACPRTPNPLP